MRIKIEFKLTEQTGIYVKTLEVYGLQKELLLLWGFFIKFGE